VRLLPTLPAVLLLSTLLASTLGVVRDSILAVPNPHVN
jgi:hypothetical protein